MRMAKAEKADHVCAWRDASRANLAKQIAWSKRRRNFQNLVAADPAPSTMRLRAVHPATILQEQQKVWSSIWSADAPPDVSPLQHLLRLCGGAWPSRDISVEWHASVLLEIARSMTGKADGPDSWNAEAFRLLPLHWWQCFASLWRTVWSSGLLPHMWKRSRVAFLPKRVDDWRPLSVASVFLA